MVIESILTKYIAAYTINVDISGVPQFTRNTLKSIRLSTVYTNIWLILGISYQIYISLFWK